MLITQYQQTWYKLSMGIPNLVISCTAWTSPIPSTPALKYCKYSGTQYAIKLLLCFVVPLWFLRHKRSSMDGLKQDTKKLSHSKSSNFTGISLSRTYIRVFKYIFSDLRWFTKISFLTSKYFFIFLLILVLPPAESYNLRGRKL